jgi:hypothetical protein
MPCRRRWDGRFGLSANADNGDYGSEYSDCPLAGEKPSPSKFARTFPPACSGSSSVTRQVSFYGCFFCQDRLYSSSTIDLPLHVSIKGGQRSRETLWQAVPDCLRKLRLSDGIDGSEAKGEPTFSRYFSSQSQPKVP